MAPTSVNCSTKLLKHVCMLMNQPAPKYTNFPKDGGFQSYVDVMNTQYAGKIGGSLAEAWASAASNALKKILEGNSGLRKDELVQEYLARLDGDRKEVQVRVDELSALGMKYVKAVTSMRDVNVGILAKAMKKRRDRSECVKFLSMGYEERSKWLESLGSGDRR